MRALQFENSEVEVSVWSNGLRASYEKCKGRQKNIESAAEYLAPPGDFRLANYETGELGAASSNAAPVFFENRDYFFGIRFKL